MTDEMFTFLVVHEDGTSHEHHHRLTATETIDEVVRAKVGGWLELIRIYDRALSLWCDEEGRLHARPVNPVGSRLAQLLGGRPVVYVGPIAITGNHRDSTVSLTRQQIEQLLVLLRDCR